MPTVNYYKSKETLLKVIGIVTSRIKGAYLRFGDGDINLANGTRELLQDTIPALTEEMREALALSGENVLKTLPLCCRKYNGLEPGMFPGNHECPDEWCDGIIARSASWWGSDDMEVYCPIALHFQASVDPVNTARYIKSLFSAPDWILLIGNEGIPPGVVEALTMGKPHAHIKSPAQGAYSAIDQIEQQAMEWITQQQGYGIVITSMGCSGRALQKRLFNKTSNLFLFDFGSLMDALCGWDTRAWISLSQFNGNNFLKLIKEA